MKRIKPTILVATIVWMGAAPAFGAPAEGLPDADQKELATLVGQLADPARSGQTKLEAAEMLLTKPYPRATEALKGFLSGINQTARIAICQAITHGGRADKSFIQPLLDMLTGKDKVLRPPAARALATYRDHGVTDKLVAIVRDRKRERGVRVVTISALQSILDKRTVDALVHLLDDPDAAVRDASADALAKLTNIKAFRTDIGLAKRWWDRNRNKAPSEWLTALADSLARSKTELEADNVRLRRRLAQALRDLYNATAPGQRQALLMGFLSDPLGDVRLAGADVMEEKIAAGEKVSQKVSDRILGMLGDSDWRVRKASALLVGHQGDAKALGALLESLTDEKTPDVRQAIMTGLGQLRMAEALEVVLVEVSSKYDRVAGAAAVALGRIAAAHPLKGDRLAEASAALIKRYYRGGGRAETVPLREAILTAMGALGQKDFLPVLRAAIKDDEATVRLAGVNALALLGGGPDAEPIASLVGDSDRGVRRAAIAALGVLGGPEHLATILQRTDPRNETDETVRQKAWEVAMHLLAEADADVLETQAQQLADRSEAIKQRIEILQ
ncbi:MAG: HEAT repeat domain-containing protein, partial [Phycisphaerae bacterium]|nr:HEAT repeat domain-containing protein [Phycisphaerae bacterium]